MCKCVVSIVEDLNYFEEFSWFQFSFHNFTPMKLHLTNKLHGIKDFRDHNNYQGRVIILYSVALFAIFENVNSAADEVYFYKLNSKQH